jgi:hypothetical protein
VPFPGDWNSVRAGAESTLYFDNKIKGAAAANPDKIAGQTNPWEDYQWPFRCIRYPSLSSSST